MNRFFQLICLIICSLAANTAFAQNLEFDSQNFNFGTITEEGGAVSTKFNFKNSGNDPVVIVSANSSCGCTVPTYSRKPITKDEESIIEVSYDPMNRPGQFTKSIDIVTAPENKKYTLTISGNVTPRTKSTEELYPFDMGGGLRFAANYFPLSTIEQGERVETQVKYINTSKRAIELRLDPINDNSILELPQSLSIERGKESSFNIAYDLKANAGVYGSLSDRYIVKVNGKESKYNLIVNGQAIDKFEPDEALRAPICNVDSRIIKFGNIEKGKLSTKMSFEIENGGVSDLIIRNIALSEGVECSIDSGSAIKPNETTKVYIWLDSTKLNYGNFSSYITLTVNDPDQPVQRIRVTAIVVAK